MAIRDALPFGNAGATGSNWSGSPASIEADAELVESINEIDGESGPLIFLVPYKREGGIEASRRFFRSLHNVKRAGRDGKQNISDSFALEMVYWQGERRLGFRYAADTEETRSDIKDELLSTYHDSNIEMGHEPFLGIEDGQHVSTAHLRLRDPEYLKPINSYKSSPDDFRIDPYDGITSKMTGDGYGTDANVMVQIGMRPAISHADKRKLCWHYGSDSVAKQYDNDDMGIRWSAVLEAMLSTFSEGGDDDIETTNERHATSQMSEAAERIANQRNDLGYHLNIRLIAASEDADLAERHVQATANKYTNFYNADHGQGFEPVYHSGSDIRGTLRSAVSREWIDRDLIMGIVPLMGVGHPPTYLNTQGVEFTFQQGDEGPPPSAPKFEQFDQTGYYDPDQALNEMPTGADSQGSQGDLGTDPEDMYDEGG